MHENAVQALTTLALETAIKLGTNLTITEDFRMISVDYFAALQNITDDDIVIFGIANDALTVAQIAEAMIAAPSDRNDATGNEQTNRAVFPIGMLMGNAEGNGKTIMHGRKTIRWTFSDTNGWAWFAFNPGSALTTGATLRVYSKAYGVWVT